MKRTETLTSACPVEMLRTRNNSAGFPDFSGASVYTISGICAQNNHSEVLIRGTVEEGDGKEQFAFPLLMEQYLQLKPEKGTITEEEYDTLRAASELCRALRSGESLLSYGANSAQMLTRKLMQRGYRREVATAAVEALSGMGLIDEEKDMRRETEKCLLKLWGEKRISAHLWSRGFNAEVLSALPEVLSEVDFSENCAKLIRKHYGSVPENPDELHRMCAFLSRYGYTLEQIRGAIRQVRSEP